MKRRPAPDPCPNCDESVPRNAIACPHCGADWSTGWNEDGDTSGRLDLPDEDFDYDDFVRREFDDDGKARTHGDNKRWIALTAAILVVAFILGWLIL